MNWKKRNLQNVWIPFFYIYLLADSSSLFSFSNWWNGVIEKWFMKIRGRRGSEVHVVGNSFVFIKVLYCCLWPSWWRITVLRHSMYLGDSFLLRISRMTSPERIFLKTVMASAWDIPSSDWAFTDTTSSPATCKSSLVIAKGLKKVEHILGDYSPLWRLKTIFGTTSHFCYPPDDPLTPFLSYPQASHPRQSNCPCSRQIALYII